MEEKKNENVKSKEDEKVIEDKFIKDVKDESNEVKKIKDEFVKMEKDIKVKQDIVGKKEDINMGKSADKELKSLLKAKNPVKSMKKKNVSFAEKVTPHTLKVEIEDSDGENDTDLIIDEDNDDDNENTKDVLLSQVNLNINNDEDDIPVSQIKHGERMVKYRAHKKDNDSDSDEFDTSSQEGAEVNACLEVVTGIVEEIIDGLVKSKLQVVLSLIILVVMRLQMLF